MTDNNLHTSTNSTEKEHESSKEHGTLKQGHNSDVQPVNVDSETRKPRTWLIVAFAVFLVWNMSFLPWGSLTGRFFKDYDIFSDLHPQDTQSTESDDIIDPNLLAAMASDNDSEIIQGSSAQAEESLNMQLPDEIEACDNAVVEVKDHHVDGNVIIEDYTPDGTGLRHLKTAIANKDKRPVRIAIIGDSYIEGDILSQDIRQLLQDTYGGNGTGYLAPVTDKGGFRRSVVQTNGTGWDVHDIRHSSKSPYLTLSGEFYTTSGQPTSKYKGTRQVRHAENWNSSRILFIAPSNGTVTTTTDAGTITHSVTASESVQAIIVDEPTSQFSFTTDVPGITLLGVWLNDNNGIALDCMSLRGDSGLSHKTLNNDLAAQMRQWVDYDMIIVEYGINALSSKQTDYSFYANTMVKVVNALRAAYPKADILVMGIGDRGQKQGSEVHSMPTASAMVDAQREVARRTQTLFWDTRDAMGGEDAIVEWRNQKLVNADYIHLNHKGGAHLASIFVEALKQALEK